jgi:hypothetical protein
MRARCWPFAPTPTEAATLARARIAVALRRCGRQRNIESLADTLHRALRQPHLRQQPRVEQALGPEGAQESHFVQFHDADYLKPRAGCT